MKRIFVAMAVLAASLPASAQVIGNAAVGTTDYPQGGMRRVSKLTLSSDSYSGLYVAAYDGARYAYFGTSHNGWVIKVDLSGDVPQEVGAVQCPGAGNFTAAVIDPGAGYGYFGSVAKIKLDDGTGKPQCVGALPLGHFVGGMTIDLSDADPAKHYILAGTFETSAANVYKIAPGAGDALPTVVGSVTLDAANGEKAVRRVVLDARDPLPENHAALFGVIGLSPDPAPVVKVAYGAGNNPVRIGATIPDSGDHDLGSAVIDPAAGYAYFGSDQPGAPARVIRVALNGTGQAPTRVDHQVLANGEILLSTAVADAGTGFAWFGCDLTYPANIYKWNLNTFAEMHDLTLQGGSAIPPANGINDSDSPETKYGEVFLQSSVIDAGKGYAWFGTDSDKGQIVKVALSEKSAIKATRAGLGEIAIVTDVQFYSHAASGNARLGIYDDAAAKHLLWQSASIPLASGWNSVAIDTGVPTYLALQPATYWLAWQVDSNDNVPSYTAGAGGDGWFIEQPYGAFTTDVPAPNASNETWSIFADYLSDSIFKDGFGA